MQLVIDERADARQRDALVKILSGDVPGGTFKEAVRRCGKMRAGGTRGTRS
jgi:hypothetical protein